MNPDVIIASNLNLDITFTNLYLSNAQVIVRLDLMMMNLPQKVFEPNNCALFCPVNCVTFAIHAVA